MLLLDQSIEAGGLTLFRDGADPATFHYLPAAPRRVERGADGGGGDGRGGDARGGLELVRYRGGAEGGLLFVEADLRVDDEQLAAARDELAGRFGLAPSLVPVLFDEGNARLTVFDVASAGAAGAAGAPETAAGASPAAGASAAAGASPAADASPAVGSSPVLVERVLGTVTPSLLHRQRAIFSVPLTREGADLAAAALAGEAAPLIVSYELAFSGLRPARGLRARVEQRQVYDYLRARLTGGVLAFRADLDRETESLERQGLIEIEDVDYQGSDPAVLAERRREAVATLRELIADLFFRPAAGPAAAGAAAVERSPAVADTWSRRGRPQAAFVLRSLEQTEEASLTYDLTVARVATRRVAPQGALAPPAGGAAIRDVALEAPPVDQAIEVEIPDGADWTGVAALEVGLRCAGEERALVLTAGEPRASAVLPAGPAEHRLRVLARPEPGDLGSPPPPVEGFAPLDQRFLSLDPQRAARRRTLQLALSAPDPERPVRFSGRLTARAAADGRAVELGPERPEQELAVWGGGELVLDGDVTLPGGAAARFERTVAPSERLVPVYPPPGLVRPVTLVLHDPLGRHSAASVEIAPSAGSRRTFELTPAAPSADWLAPAGPDPLRYRVRRLLRDARVIDEDWRDAGGSLVVVGDTGLRVERITGVLLAGAGPASGGAALEGAVIRLESLAPPPGVPAAAELFLAPGEARFTADLPFLRDAPRRYRVEAQLFTAEGVTAVGPREEDAEILLLRV